MDCGVGSIVWVRRRNGSWWPGQIIGPDDLSTSHLTSPRSGTPVKLLGREDASVDWYNLEKSKRVKAFRCGEFDECIQKVESSHEMPLKKREKYARREDAILHALELERQLVKKQEKLAIASDRTDYRSSRLVKKGVAMLPVESQGNDDEKHGNLKSYMSCENEIVGGCSPLEVARDVEVDICKVTPRTRVLQDFGLKIPSLKGNLSSPVDPYVSRMIAVDQSARALASDRLCTGSVFQANGVSRQIAYQAKRSRCFYFPAEYIDSLDYKERLALRKIPSPERGVLPYRGSLVGETESTCMDDVEFDSSETYSTVSDSDSSETEPDMDEKMNIVTETGLDFEEHDDSTSSEEPDELAVTSDMPHLYPRELMTHHEAVSKWQLKGKRNNRNLVKRSYGAPDRKGVIYGAEVDFEEGRTNLNHKRMGSNLHGHQNDFSNALYDDDQMFGLEDEYSLTPRAVSKIQNKIPDLAWDEDLASREYWDDKGFTPTYGDHDQFGGRMRSMLINVDVKVQAGYRKEPVPIISLMSKLDGKAIIGHPIQVEVLKDGSSDTLITAIDDLSDDGIYIDGSSVLPQAWKTARRTANFRVPRPHLLPSNATEVAVDFPSLDQEQNFDYKKLNTGSSSHKASLQKKSSLKTHQSSADKKFFKKGLKKLSLSSLTSEHSLRNPLHDISSYKTDTLTKPEISGPTTVACIPVQLVFSRLLEKINRPPLKAASNAALLNTDGERNS